MSAGHADDQARRQEQRRLEARVGHQVRQARLGAYGQPALRALFAYSTVNEIGLMLLALETAGFHSLFQHLCIYIVTQLLVWNLSPSSPKTSEDKRMFSLCAVSLAGLPPLAGFFGKAWIFWHAATSHAWVLLAGVLLKLGGLGFLRFMLPALPAFTVSVMPLVGCLCLVSFLFSTLSTLRQVDLKKIVAYSSIAHMSLVTLANLSFPLFPNFVAELLCLVSLFALTGRMNVTLHDSIASDDMFVKFSGSWIGGGSTAGAPRLGGGVSGVFGGGGTIEQSGLGGYLLGRRRELDGHASSGPR
jgi:hypothetical protein